MSHQSSLFLKKWRIILIISTRNGFHSGIGAKWHLLSKPESLTAVDVRKGIFPWTAVSRHFVHARIKTSSYIFCSSRIFPNEQVNKTWQVPLHHNHDTQSVSSEPWAQWLCRLVKDALAAVNKYCFVCQKHIWSNRRKIESSVHQLLLSHYLSQMCRNAGIIRRLDAAWHAVSMPTRRRNFSAPNNLNRDVKVVPLCRQYLQILLRRNSYCSSRYLTTQRHHG